MKIDFKEAISEGHHTKRLKGCRNLGLQKCLWRKHMKKTDNSDNMDSEGIKKERMRGISLGGLAVLLVIALMCAGCTSEPSVPQKPSNPPAVMVDYTRTGGIAGFNDHIVVFENGDVIYSTRDRTGGFSLDAEKLHDLEQAFKNAHFTELNSTYPAPAAGADYFYYQITYGGHTVNTETTGVPETLIDIINRMDSLTGDRIQEMMSSPPVQG
jgi:hypothetical protein